MSRMTVRTKFAFLCFLIIAAAEVSVGLRYSFSPTIMPYHQQALGVSWADLSPREQMVLLALLRGTGLCALVTGITMGTLLFIPFRRGERWTRWAVAGLSLTTLVPAAWEAITLASATGAATPWPFLLLAIGLVLGGLLLAGPAGTRANGDRAGGTQPTSLAITDPSPCRRVGVQRPPEAARMIEPAWEHGGAGREPALAW